MQTWQGGEGEKMEEESAIPPVSELVSANDNPTPGVDDKLLASESCQLFHVEVV